MNDSPNPRSLGIYDCFFGNTFAWIDLSLHLQRYKSSEIPASLLCNEIHLIKMAYFHRMCS